MIATATIYFYQEIYQLNMLEIIQDTNGTIIDKVRALHQVLCSSRIRLNVTILSINKKPWYNKDTKEDKEILNSYKQNRKVLDRHISKTKRLEIELLQLNSTDYPIKEHYQEFIQSKVAYQELKLV